MSEEYFETLENFVNEVLTQTLACPREMAINALQSVCMDFFKETEIWTDTVTDTLDAGINIYEIPMPLSCTELVRVMGVRIDGIRCSSGDYIVKYHTLYLHNIPQTKTTITVEMVLRPSRFSVNIPSRFLEEYGDIIVDGALAKLKLMKGEGISWTDTDTVQVYQQRYIDGLNRTRLHTLRSRIGGFIKPGRF